MQVWITAKHLNHGFVYYIDKGTAFITITNETEITGRIKKQTDINHRKTYDFSQLGKDELAVLIGTAERTRLG